MVSARIRTYKSQSLMVFCFFGFFDFLVFGPNFGILNKVIQSICFFGRLRKFLSEDVRLFNQSSYLELC